MDCWTISAICRYWKSIEAFNTFITDYCDNRNRFDIPNISYGFINSRNFDALGKEDLYDYLGQSLKKQDQEKVDNTYRKITSIISTLDSIDTQTRNHIQKFLDRNNALVEAYNANLDQYGKLLRQIPVGYPGISDSIVKSLETIYSTILKDMPKINLFDCEDNFVIPSLKILRSNPFPPELDDTLQNCLNITLELRNEKAYIKSNLESANVQYRKVLDKIAEINEICRPKHGWLIGCSSVRGTKIRWWKKRLGYYWLYYRWRYCDCLPYQLVADLWELD